MSNNTLHNTHLTRQVKTLIAKVYGRSSIKDSILDRAIEYFNNQSYVEKKLASFTDPTISAKIKKSFHQQLRIEQAERHTHLVTLCLEIIDITEAESMAECNRKSAQVLGTIQLLSPTEGKKVALSNEMSKPLYKAVLCLRLLDRLCINNRIADPFISQYLVNISPAQYEEFSVIDPQGYLLFTHQVKIPLLIAALIQDIGNYHPDAIEILKGNEGTADPFRTLDIEARKQLLQINYRETIKYLVDGIGATGYMGNSKADRDKFNQAENEKLIFIKHLLKSSINPKKGIGNLLKVPQIYTSIILSTKTSYNYKLLPKVYQALNQNADRGSCSKVVVDALYQITGMFPQGFGITYMPTDNEGEQQERYEYAIVNQLYPPNPEQPLCRTATRFLTFIGYGQNIEILCESNLYFTETAKKMASISKERLNEILELLASNYHERQKLDLLPRCWHSGEYFSIKENQKLWNKTD